MDLWTLRDQDTGSLKHLTTGVGLLLLSRCSSSGEQHWMAAWAAWSTPSIFEERCFLIGFGVWLLFLASSRQVGKLEGENFGNVCSLQYRVGLQVWGLRLLQSFMFFWRLWEHGRPLRLGAHLRGPPPRSQELPDPLQEILPRRQELQVIPSKEFLERPSVQDALALHRSTSNTGIVSLA